MKFDDVLCCSRCHQGLEKKFFSIKYMDTDALPQAAPVAVSPYRHWLWLRGPSIVGRTLEKSPRDGLARGKNVTKRMVFYFSLICNLYFQNDPSPPLFHPQGRLLLFGDTSFLCLWNIYVPQDHAIPLLLSVSIFSPKALCSHSLSSLELAICPCSVF